MGPRHTHISNRSRSRAHSARWRGWKARQCLTLASRYTLS
jgi:hypothetical protein